MSFGGRLISRGGPSGKKTDPDALTMAIIVIAPLTSSRPITCHCSRDHGSLALAGCIGRDVFSERHPIGAVVAAVEPGVVIGR